MTVFVGWFGSSSDWLPRIAVMLVAVVSASLAFGAGYVFAPVRQRGRRIVAFSASGSTSSRRAHRPAVDLDAVRELLTRVAVLCTTTTTHFGCDRADQYRVASVVYLDLGAVFGGAFAEQFFTAYPETLLRTGLPVDEAMRAMGDDILRLSEAVFADAVAGDAGRVSAYVAARLAGFIEAGRREGAASDVRKR